MTGGGRSGFTTGSCAAAAARAAAFMLLSGEKTDSVRIVTPAGVEYIPDILDIRFTASGVSCGVRKEAGDDPDVTDGAVIRAEVKTAPGGWREVTVLGGEGVGTVTRPGLDQPVGSAAINSVPRRMIRDEVRAVMEQMGYEGAVRVTISVPGGAELAEQTFNARLGIVGGISIIGTTGVVEPMSTKALIDTIRVGLRQQKAEGADYALISPGNYGLEFLRSCYGCAPERVVLCSNFIGEAVDLARETGFRRMLLAGHVGKLVKVSGGIMNTHSREADARMELLAAAAVRCSAPRGTVTAVLDSVSTEEAYGHLKAAGAAEACSRYLIQRICYYLSRRAGPDLSVQCVMFSSVSGILGASEEAEKWLLEVGRYD